jgi:hypothetical protein
MAKHHGPVLVDTMIIIECWRVSAWKALTGGYGVETVEMCEIETQTGLQRRRVEQQIDRKVLRATLKAVHPVSDLEQARALLKDDLMRSLDAGERMLWAHALERPDAWVLCGPDKASLRLGVRLGFKDRLISLEGLLGDAGHKPRIALGRQFTRQWHNETLTEMVMSEAGSLARRSPAAPKARPLKKGGILFTEQRHPFDAKDETSKMPPLEAPGAKDEPGRKKR